MIFLLALACWGSELSVWASRQPNPPVPPVAESYEFTGAFFSSLAAAAAERPGVVQVEKIGESVAGRPIWAFHVGEPGWPVEHRVLIFAGIHALEWIGTETAVAYLHELIARPVRRTRVTVIPLLNPDGRAKVEADLMVGNNTYRRGNHRNVDLNRDFAVNRDAVAIWKAIIPGYYSTSPEALSQPESRALDAIAARGNYDRAASLHAFGGFFYYPWSGRFAPPADRERFVRLGRAMEQAQGKNAYHTLQLGHWAFFFRAQGSEIDHLYGKYGIQAYLIELSRSGLRPLHPKTWRTHFRWYNPERSERHRELGVRAIRELVRHPYEQKPSRGDPEVR